MPENNYLTLRNRALSIYKLIKKQQKKNYPTPDLNHTFKELDDIYNSFIQKYLNSESGEEINSNELYNINTFITITNDVVLKLLHNASAINDPKSITIPIKEKIQSNGSSAIYIPELIWDVNYYIGEVSETYNKYIKPLGLGVSLSTRIFKFGIPHFYQDDVLMSGIIGHELGHYFDLYGGLNISEKLLTEFTNDNTLIDSLVPFVVSENGVLKDRDIEQKKGVVKIFLSSSNDYFKNWIKEFVADTLGIMLYGPASLFASEYLIQSINVTNMDSRRVNDYAALTHPRNIYRYKIKILTLDSLGYKEYPLSFIEEFRHSEKKWAEAVINYQDDIRRIGNFSGKIVGINATVECLQVLENYLSENLLRIVEKCQEDIPENLIYSPSTMSNSIEILAKKMGELLPPNEITYSNASDSISIVNAGWLSYFTSSYLLNEKYGTDDKLLDAINNMLSRALGAAHIHRRWINVGSE